MRRFCIICKTRTSFRFPSTESYKKDLYPCFGVETLSKDEPQDVERQYLFSVVIQRKRFLVDTQRGIFITKTARKTSRAKFVNTKYCQENQWSGPVQLQPLPTEVLLGILSYLEQLT